MKVLYTFGGMPHYMDALLNKIVAKGVDVTVVVPSSGNATIGKGVKMVDGGKYKRISSCESRMWYGKPGFKDLPAIISAESPDVVVMGWPYFLQVALQKGLKKQLVKCGAKLLIREIPFQTPPFGQIKSYFSQNPMINESMSILSRGASFLIKQWLIAQTRKKCYASAAGTLNYSTVAYDIIPSYGVPRERIFVTYNSTDTDALMRVRDQVIKSSPILPPSSQRILHIGRLVKWKRVDLLIDAFAIVHKKHQKSELVIIGNGPELDNLKKQASELGLGDSCKFVGAVYDPAILGAYMYESTVYVLAGMGGLSINDAMTYSMPVICSVCDGTERDLVKHGENGFFFKNGDSNDLADKIDTVISSPEMAASMGEKSFKIINEQININTVSNRYIDAFNKIIAD